MRTNLTRSTGHAATSEPCFPAPTRQAGQAQELQSIALIRCQYWAGGGEDQGDTGAQNKTRQASKWDGAWGGRLAVLQARPAGSAHNLGRK